MMAAEDTILQGAKVWFTFWDSAALQDFEKGITGALEGVGLTVETDRPPGTGFLVGPLYSYQLPSGRWSASLALMILSDFQQDFSGTVNGAPITADSGLRRQDLDFAVTYSPFDYVRLFVGYKHVLISVSSYADLDTFLTGLVIWNSAEASARIPTLGAGFAYPVTDRISVGGQVGLRYAFWKSVLTDGATGLRAEMDMDNSFGFAGELTMSAFPWNNLLLQLGYRYEWLRVISNSGTPAATTSDDVSHGPMVAVLFVR